MNRPICPAVVPEKSGRPPIVGIIMLVTVGVSVLAGAVVTVCGFLVGIAGLI